jgi:phosphatidylinositol-3-phosphatase
MENHQWPQVLGDPAQAPYETSLAKKCGTATHYASVGSPSLPNYLGATSGDSHGIQDDSGPAAHPLTGDNLFRQVRASGGTERSFQESMGQPCRQDSAGSYAVKHNPAAYYVGGSDRAACMADDVDLTALAGQLAGAGGLPTFAFITPDLCHDTHDCSVATGDAWLTTWVPRILASPSYRDGSTAVFIVWDEYTPMPNLVVAPSVPPGTSVAQPFDHYSLLWTTEELLGLPKLGRAAGATSMRGPFRL